MNRLRVRVELNRRKAGVPLDEMVSVVEETRKFFHLLAEDVQIPADRGEWLASNFDPESLNFTAEFNGPASTDQIRAFGSAFGGATSLRQETIAQFTHIADFIGEDELVGFGLYQSDQEAEPSDWRCLSRRDALRFADEIRLLAKASGESAQESPLPAVMNGSVGGRRLFKDRREREALVADPSTYIRELEANMARRISLLENEVEAQARKMQGLGSTQQVSDERFAKLLGAMESFWSHAPRQLALSAGEQIPAGNAALDDALPAATGNLFAEIPASVRRAQSSRRRWIFGLATATAAIILVLAVQTELGRRWSQSLWPARVTPDRVAASSIQRWTASKKSRLESTTAEPALTVGAGLPLIGQEQIAAPSPSVPAVDKASADKVGVGKTPAAPKVRALEEVAAVAPRREPTADSIRQIALDIPSDLRGTITVPVLIHVTVDTDPKGRVTTAKVASTQGEEASLFTDEALRAARRFRFQPMQKGSKAATNQMALTFVFDPEPNTPSTDSAAPGN